MIRNSENTVNLNMFYFLNVASNINTFCSGRDDITQLQRGFILIQD